MKLARKDTTQQREQRHARRKRTNALALGASMFAMAFGLVWLGWILFETLHWGLAGLHADTFLLDTPAPNEEGGLRNAITGSLVMVGLATFVGSPIGILTGIFLAEFDGRLAAVTRFVNDILLSAPSIVVGLFVYAVVVAPTHTFSAYAGGVALALLVIPVVTRTTENMLRLVPNGLREAAYALGCPKWKMVWGVAMRAARAGVVTGVLLAVARISGETAPLLFTALSHQFSSWNLGAPMASLPVTIFKFAMSPYENWRELAWAGVFLITMVVLGLNIIARIWVRSRA